MKFVNDAATLACFRELKKSSSAAVSLAKKTVAGWKKSAVSQFKTLQKLQKDNTFDSYAGNIVRACIIDGFAGMAAELKPFAPEVFKAAAVKKLFRDLAEKYAPASCRLDIYELSPEAARMAYMTVTVAPGAVDAANVPADIAGVLPLLDGSRTLYEAYVIYAFFSGSKITADAAKAQVAFFRDLAGNNLCTVREAGALSAQDIHEALRNSGLKESDKLVVHSAYASLGKVQGGPAGAARALADYFGEKGVLMMPTFDFPYYCGSGKAEYFDVINTPSVVGAITDEFRKFPEVHRSLNPSHSIAVYGEKNIHYISDHHKTLTMAQDSPLGKLETEDGYALMIGCPDTVTFMHVVETTNRVHCLGYRSEEFKTKLPDGRVVPVRTWGWRNGHCPGYDLKAIYEYMRKHNVITEVMVRHSCWHIFKLSDYRKAYEKVVLHGKNGCMHCPLLPRDVKQCCESDWDWEKMCVKENTTAYIGEYVKKN